MKKAELKNIIRDIVTELSSTGTGAAFTPGTGAQYATPKAFGRTGENKGTKFIKKLGYVRVQRPKRPSHTKLVDYLNQ
jgi:hypothetical protein